MSLTRGDHQEDQCNTESAGADTANVTVQSRRCSKKATHSCDYEVSKLSLKTLAAHMSSTRNKISFFI